jgi:hypothetical protein
MKRTCRENPKGGHFEIKLITSLEILLKRLDIENMLQYHKGQRLTSKCHSWDPSLAPIWFFWCLYKKNFC